MASTAKAGQTARHKARERRIALEVATKARNDRIENWTTAVFSGAEDRQRAHHAEASAEDTMGDALHSLAGEGLSASDIADLCEMTVGEVHKLTKRRRVPTHDQPPRPSRSSGLSAGSPATGELVVDGKELDATPSSQSQEAGTGAIND